LDEEEECGAKATDDLVSAESFSFTLIKSITPPES
jgi:hypothetical protein